MLNPALLVFNDELDAMNECTKSEWKKIKWMKGACTKESIISNFC